MLGEVDGGDRRDRTDDLKLAKLPLSQLSYVPVTEKSLDPEFPSPEGTAGGFARKKNGGPGKT